MARYILKRLIWMIPTLLGISFVTFLLMELAPGDRVTQIVDSDPQMVQDFQNRQVRIRRLQLDLGLRDRTTGELLSVGFRYWRWLRKAAVLDFSGDAIETAEFRARILRALPVTIFLNVLALLLALAIAVPLGAKTGMNPGGALDRTVGGATFVAFGVPEFLTATFFVLVLGSFFPIVGLRSADAGRLGPVEGVLDMLAHLVLPVTTLAIGYGVVLVRFLRESVGRAANSDFVLALRAFGTKESIIRRRALRNGLSPVVTILGTMLPTLVSGTVVVENIFSLPGLGALTIDATLHRDMPMVMALTMLVSVVTLFSLLLSDILQRVVDPRVALR